MHVYNPTEIEERWQQRWKEENFYRAVIDDTKTKYFVLEMFPYPSGKLHMGHMRVYSIGDVLARFLWMRGYNVIHPMGWDAFGLPAENAAIEHKVNPSVWTMQNIEHMKKQQNRLGLSYDWHREVNTSAPDYYRWSQWLFLLMYRRGLAYRKKAGVNWCATCNTVLANEQVEKGLCWRCSSAVESRELEQWFLRITDYAEQLLNDLDILEDWPERVKVMQRNWIGRSEGAEIAFKLKDFPGQEIRTFTTRPDTLFGVTYMVLAPEHPLVKQLVEGTENEEAVLEFVARVRQESEIERTSDEAPKVGLFTGRFAVNPVSGEEIPVLVGNYVLMAYGTGAVMGVPAHDQRDFLFARQYSLPIRVVIQHSEEEPSEETMTEAYTGAGRMVNSGPFNGLNSSDGITAITTYLAEQGQGHFRITYRLRDWLISRQRYWGAPIPIVYCENCGIVPVPEEDLPVELPVALELSDNRVPNLAGYPTFVQTTCSTCGGPARRETDTMDTFICSSWYFLRFTSPNYVDAPFDSKEVDYWMPVDQYVGGIEHAVLHLLYARFFTKVLNDAGLIKVKEPFSRLLAQGMVYKDGAKMSKSKGNVVTPDEIVERYGADTGRLFILFAAPPEKDLDWSDQGVEGCHRFLRRVWRLVEECAMQFKGERGCADPGEAEMELQRSVHAAIKKVTHDIGERFNFNTAISAIMELVNSIYAYRQASSGDRQNHAVLRESLKQTVLLLAPFVPHLAEEIWHSFGYGGSVHRQPWPQYDPHKLQVNEVEVVVQINGKVRGKITVPANYPEDKLIEAARSNQRVDELLIGKEIVKTVAVPGRLVNIVVK
ncbi:MAG TPA: leucine--tRNA ligase [Candidatus Limnocylindrales bacterium]|nr:leucine--tRNA ligase [Candidatus Limnocylindrales bacterium]